MTYEFFIDRLQHGTELLEKKCVETLLLDNSGTDESAFFQ